VHVSELPTVSSSAVGSSSTPASPRATGSFVRRRSSSSIDGPCLCCTHAWARRQTARGEGGNDWKVKYWNAKRGYGFVAREDGSGDVFCHVSSLAEGLEGLAVGNKVEFDETVSPHSGKAEAKNVRVLG